MFAIGIGLKLLVSALLLSAIQGWALARDGARRVLRHLVAWAGGTLLVGMIYRIALAPPASDTVARVGHLSVVVGVGAALFAGSLHARQTEGDRHEAPHDLWIGRAVAQGIALFVVGALGMALLVVVAIASLA